MKPSFDNSGRLGKAILESSVECLKAVSQDSQAIGVASAQYAQKTIEAGSETFAKLMTARDLESAFRIQDDFFKKAYEGFIAEATQINGLYADLARDAYRPFEAVVVRAR